MTIEGLRERLALELDDLGPAPDPVPAAARQGAAVVRRRRLAGGTAVAVAGVASAVGGGYLLRPGDTAAPEPDDDVIATSGPSAPAAPDPLADGHVTTEEWNETVRRTLEEILPDRYQAVTTLPPEAGSAQFFGTEGGEPRLELAASVQGREEREDVRTDETSWSCASQDAARGLLTCAEASFGDGWFAVATTEYTDPTGDPRSDQGPATYGTDLLVLHDDVFFGLHPKELGWDEVSPNRPAGITAEELVAMARTPEFLEMMRVGVQWQIDWTPPKSRDEDGETTVYLDYAEPSWPS